LGKVAELSTGRVLVIKPDYGEDLMESVKAVADKFRVETGVFWAIGAAKKAAISYYDQSEKKYVRLQLNKPLEILSCIGNISKFKGETLIHAHITLSDREGEAYGGHLEKGTQIFSGEVFLVETKGLTLNRAYDERTGLNLLKI
jgi:hypothetical protein